MFLLCRKDQVYEFAARHHLRFAGSPDRRLEPYASATADPCTAPPRRVPHRNLPHGHDLHPGGDHGDRAAHSPAGAESAHRRDGRRHDPAALSPLPPRGSEDTAGRLGRSRTDRERLPLGRAGHPVDHRSESAPVVQMHPPRGCRPDLGKHGTAQLPHGAYI